MSSSNNNHTTLEERVCMLHCGQWTERWIAGKKITNFPWHWQLLAALYSQWVESSRQFKYPHRGQEQSRFYWKTVVLLTLNPSGKIPWECVILRWHAGPSIIPTQTIPPLILFLLMSNRWGSWLALGLSCHRWTLGFNINQPRDHTTAEW